MSDSTIASPIREVRRPDGRPAEYLPAQPVAALVSSVIAEMKATPPPSLADEFADLWNAHPATAGQGVTVNWRRTVESWEAAGLTAEKMLEFLDYIGTRDDIPGARRWRYFCGCCWRTVRASQGVPA